MMGELVNEQGAGQEAGKDHGVENAVTDEISGDSDTEFLRERWGESTEGCRHE